MRRKLPNGTLWTVPLQDDHIWPDERHFIPQGRKDYAVQVGGVNVYPAHVEKVLASHVYVGWKGLFWSNSFRRRVETGW